MSMDGLYVAGVHGKDCSRQSLCISSVPGGQNYAEMNRGYMDIKPSCKKPLMQISRICLTTFALSQTRK